MKSTSNKVAKKPAKFSLKSVVKIILDSDPDFMQKFYVFMKENKIRGESEGCIGNPEYTFAYYSEDDAEKIEKWLLEQNVEKV